MIAPGVPQKCPSRVAAATSPRGASARGSVDASAAASSASAALPMESADPILDFPAFDIAPPLISPPRVSRPDATLTNTNGDLIHGMESTDGLTGWNPKPRFNTTSASRTDPR